MALKDTASLALIPAAYKTSKIYSAIPTDGDGDFTFTRGSNGTRVNKAGLVETMGTNIGRLNYNLTNGTPASCPSLLLEPSRTNNASRSETPQDGSWSDPLSEWTLLTETTTSPRGDQTRVFNLEDSTGTLIRCQDFSVAAGTYTISFYIKDIGGNLTGGIVDLGDQGSGDTTPSLSTVGSEWVRVSRTITTTSTKTFLDIQLTFTGSTNKVGIWGLQLEAGSYATSYIQTTGTAAVTRTVDTCKLENFANMPTDYPFTVFWQGKIDDINFSQFAFSILDISSNVKYLGLSFSTTGYFQIHRRNSNYDIDSQTFSMSVGDVLKIAIAFTSNTTYKCYINGSLIRNETSEDVVDFDFNDILIGQQRVVSDGAKRNQCSEFMLFNEALSDTELQTLTS